MVGGGQARQAQFVIAGVAAECTGAVADELGAALAEGAVELPGLTEAAAADTAAQHLDTGAILHRADQRHDEVFRRGEAVHILDDGLGHAGRDARAVRGNGLNAAILLVGHIVEGRHVDTGDLRQCQQQLFFVPALLFALFNRCADILQHLFALAQLHNVEEIRHRLGVADAGAARNNERPALVAVSRPQRNTRQAQHSQDVCVGQLIFQREADDIKIAQRILALEAVQRNVQPLHLFFHVGPGHEGTLTPPVFVAVQNVVQNFFAQERHADFVSVREAERHAHIYFGFVFVDAARLAARVTARLLYQAQGLFKFRGKFRHIGEPSLFVLCRKSLFGNSKFIIRCHCQNCNHLPLYVPKR